MAIYSTQKSASLRSNCLSFADVLSQSVSLAAPSIGVALNAPLVFASAGNGTWLAFAFATVGLVLVSLNINQFARRSASAGALYLYVAKGLGSTVGIVCGWALALAYLLVAATVSMGFAKYAHLVLAELGIEVPLLLLCALCIGFAWYYAYTDIQLAAMLMIIIEIVAMGFILLLAFLILGQQGFRPDIEQLTLAGTTPGGLSLGMVIAVFSFVGFESAATLGDEAKSPLRSIPRSLVWSALLIGLFFVLLSYSEVLGFRGNATPFNEAASPINVLADLVGADLLGVGLTVGIAFSCFSCSLASINAASRIAYALARHRFFPAPLGLAHTRNQTPHIAVSISALVAFLIPGSMLLFGVSDSNIYGYLGTISTYGFLTAYLLVSIAAPIYLSQRGELRSHHLIISILAGFFMLIPVAGSFYPVPAFPYNIFPYFFLLYLAAGGWLFSTLSHRPQIIQNIEGDDETVQGQLTD